MTTQQLPLEEIFSRLPGSSDDGSPPPRRRRRSWGEAAERAGLRWTVVVWVLVLAALIAADPGRMTFDTKLGVDIDPVGFYRQLWHLWDPLEWFGGLQDQYIGYAFPMGAFYLVAHLLHVPVWLTERVWMSLLLMVAFWGPVKLAGALGIGSRPTRLLAGAAFALWPTFTILVGSTSAGVLPGVLAPWAVLPLTRSGTGRTAAARSGLVVASMGGVNAVSTLAAIVPAGLYVLTRPGRRRRVLAAWWTAAVLLATSWWLVPLLYQARYGFNFLPYIEQAANTTQTMSAATALRGSGNWVAYLNFGQPWLTAGSVMTGSAWAVAGGTVAAATGLAGLARRDLPEAGWLRGTAAVAALWALTGYAGPLGGPLHHQVQALLDGPASALRNVFKIEPALAVVLALGIAHVLARGVWPRPAARRTACAAAVVVLAGMGLPYLSGKVLQSGSFRQVPGYWQQAATWLASHHKTETTLVVPADSHGIYTWGQPIDEPLEPLARSPWVQRNLVPFSGGGVSDLLNGAEQAIESGTAAPGLPGYLARAGIRYVLVRNDLDPAQLGYTPPTVVHVTLAASGFTRVAAFGQPVPAGPVGQGTALQVEAIEPQYPPVEIFQAANPAERPAGPMAVLPAVSTTLVDGGPASLLQLLSQGMPRDRAAVIAGQDAGAGPPAVQQDVTDGLRRADTVFGLPTGNTSYTYTANGTIPPDNPQGAPGQPPRQLLPDGTAGHQTVAVLTGAASVTASSAGSWLWEVPQGDPVNAFDGDPSTAWTEASSGHADGQWIQIGFGRPLHLAGPLTVRLLDDMPRPVATRLVITTAAGRAVTGTRVTGAPQPVSVPSGTTTWLRITIAAARGGTPGGPGAGISEVTIPGVRVARFLQPAEELSGPAPSFSFHRETGTTFGPPGVPQEPALDRTYTTPAAQRFAVSASVTAVPGAALNALLDRVGSSPPAQVHITASSTFGSLPALRPQNLLESSGGTGWLAAGPSATLHLRWKGQRTISEIDLVTSTVGIAAEPTRVLITSPGGTRDVPVPQSGVLRFPPLITGQLDISFPGVMPTTAYNPLAGRAQQLPVGLARLSVPALAGLSTGLPAPAAPFRLGCGQGPPVTVDGHTYPTSVAGTVSDLTDLAPLPLHLCTKGAALTLSAGRHWLTSPGTGVPLAITDLSLSAATAPPVAASNAVTASNAVAAARQLRIGSWGSEYRTATIGPGRQSYLEVHEVANPGWTATLNGHRLTPVTLDGWQQAFIVPAGAGGQVVMAFTPATGYRWLLAGSVLAICVLIAAAAWRWRRPRLRPGPAAAGLAGPALTENSPGLGPLGYWLAVAAAAVVLALIGGPLVTAVPVVLVLGWWRPRWVPWLAFTAMCLAGALAMTSLGHGAGAGAEAGAGAFGWPAQAAALIALAAALTPAARGTRRRTRGRGERRVTALRDAPVAPASWPFAPIEELDVYLENAQEPSLVQLETHAPGHLDPAALEAALAGALAADPAARRHAAATSRWSRRLRWETAAPAVRPAPGLLTVAGWDSPGQLAALREQQSTWPMSLNHTAARVLLAVGPEHDVVIVQTHHAAFDGVSSLALLSAICAGYRDGAGAGSYPQAASPSRPGSGQVRPLAPHRSRPGQAAAGRRGRSLPGLPLPPGVVTRIAAHAAQPDRPGYGYVQKSVPVPRPARQGSGPHPTVNDLLVAAMILAVDRWNAAHGRRSGTIRITVPVNGRDPQGRWKGPGNLSRLIRVSARPGQCADAAGLLAHVAAQTRAGKLQPRPGLDAVSRLLGAGWAPIAVKRHTARLARRLARPVCTDTSLVSNLGMLHGSPGFSGSGREPLWFSGPAPMPRGLAVGAVTVAGRLHLCVHYRHALLDPGAAEDFTAGYCRALAELAALPQGRTP